MRITYIRSNVLLLLFFNPSLVSILTSNNVVITLLPQFLNYFFLLCFTCLFRTRDMQLVNLNGLVPRRVQ